MLLERWPVTIELPVQWGDMDALGHVNNTVYLRWFESARMEYFRRIGLMAAHGAGIGAVGPILARSTIDYRLPLAAPDQVRVECTVSKLGNTSLLLGHRVRSERHDRAIAAEGEAVIVLFEYATGRKVPLPQELRRAIQQLEASAA